MNVTTKAADCRLESLDECHFVDFVQDCRPREDFLKSVFSKGLHTVLTSSLLELRRASSLQDELANWIREIEKSTYRGTSACLHPRSTMPPPLLAVSG